MTNANEVQQPSTTYFHVAPIRLGIGTIIYPGNWGRIIKTCYPAPNNNHILLPYRESIFEYARLSLAPGKVSRLSCLFACMTLEEAGKYRAANAHSNIIYEVAPAGEIASSHVADYNLIMLPQSGQYFDVFHLARRYWTDTSPANQEILLPCPARIVALPEGPHTP